MVNKVQLIGRLGKDPEVRATQENVPADPLLGGRGRPAPQPDRGGNPRPQDPGAQAAGGGAPAPDRHRRRNPVLRRLTRNRKARSDPGFSVLFTGDVNRMEPPVYFINFFL